MTIVSLYRKVKNYENTQMNYPSMFILLLHMNIKVLERVSFFSVIATRAELQMLTDAFNATKTHIY